MTARDEIFDADAENDAGLISWWNEEICPLCSAPRIREMTEARRKAWAKRVKEKGQGLKRRIREEVAGFAAFARTGGWFGFDWLLRPGNLEKLLDGNYRDMARQATDDVVESVLRRQEEKR